MTESDGDTVSGEGAAGIDGDDASFVPESDDERGEE